MTTLRRLAASGAVLGAAGAAYALAEARAFRLQEHRLPVGGAVPRTTVLHVSDTHVQERDVAKARWLARLPELMEVTPDFVIATGDLIEDPTGIDPLVDALEGLGARYGKWYVLGSHDYFHSTFPGFLKYFTGNRDVARAKPADTPRLEARLAETGWTSLTNRTETVETPDGRVRLSGVDDPYIHRDDTRHLGRKPGDALAIGVMHAPEVVSDYALHGYDLMLAGHTHGGQVRVPFAGAVVTNCDLPCALAAGPTRVGSSWLHVSPGLAQGKFVPLRFNCRPEVTLLTLEPST